MTCFDRIDETTAAWRALKDGRNLLMLAPRRIGKTVLLNHLRDTAAENGFRAVLLDVEGYREEKDFFRQCCNAIQEELGTGKRVLAALSERLSRLLHSDGGDGKDWRHWLLHTDWRDFAEHLISHLDDHGGEAPWLILVDELPVFLLALQRRDGETGIGDFLYWLRNQRQRCRRVRWLYAGSIGLDGLARRYGIEGTLNDLDAFPLAPFAPDTARAFIADIARRRGCSVEPAAADIILERLGWLSPYYLEKIAEDACAIPGVLDQDRANAAIDRLLDQAKRLYWSTWREHLDRNFPEPERGRLYGVLESVAQVPEGANADTLLTALNRGGEPLGRAELRQLLDTLLADGYLSAEPDGRYRFRMRLLREWWLRYVVL